MFCAAYGQVHLTALNCSSAATAAAAAAAAAAVLACVAWGGWELRDISHRLCQSKSTTLIVNGTQDKHTAAAVNGRMLWINIYVYHHNTWHVL
jgi:hypothetical protein